MNSRESSLPQCYVYETPPSSFQRNLALAAVAASSGSTSVKVKAASTSSHRRPLTKKSVIRHPPGDKDEKCRRAIQVMLVCISCSAFLTIVASVSLLLTVTSVNVPPDHSIKTENRTSTADNDDIYNNNSGVSESTLRPLWSTSTSHNLDGGCDKRQCSPAMQRCFETINCTKNEKEYMACARIASPNADQPPIMQTFKSGCEVKRRQICQKQSIVVLSNLPCPNAMPVVAASHARKPRWTPSVGQMRKYKIRCTDDDKRSFIKNLISMFEKEYDRRPSDPARSQGRRRIQVPSGQLINPAQNLPGVDGLFRDQSASSIPNLYSSKSKRAVEWKFKQLDISKNNLLDGEELKALKSIVKRTVRPRRCGKSFNWVAKCDLIIPKKSITAAEWSFCFGVANRIQQGEISRGGFNKIVAGNNARVRTTTKRPPPVLKKKMSCMEKQRLENIQKNQNERFQNTVFVPECQSRRPKLYREYQCQSNICFCVSVRTGQPTRGGPVTKDGTPPLCNRQFKGCKRNSLRKDFLRKLTILLENELQKIVNSKLPFSSRRLAPPPPLSNPVLLNSQESLSSPLSWSSSSSTSSSQRHYSQSRRVQVIQWLFDYWDIDSNEVVRKRELKPFRAIINSIGGGAGNSSRFHKCSRNFLKFCKGSRKGITKTEITKCSNPDYKVPVKTRHRPSSDRLHRGGIRAGGQNPLNMLKESG